MADESAGAELSPPHMLPEILRPTTEAAAPTASLYDAPFVDALDAFQRAYLEHSMREAQGGISEASRRTGIDRANLRRMLRRHGLLSSSG